MNCLADVIALQQNVDIFMSWSCDWLLCFNAWTCKEMHIGRKNIESTYKLTYFEGILDLSEGDSACDLRVEIQSNFQFGRHISNLCAKANITVGITMHTFFRIYIDMFRILSKSLVQQILEYSSSVCGPYTNASARKIKQIQRRATKIIENVKDVSYSDRHRIISMPKLQLRRLRTVMIQAYKILNRYEDIYLECFFYVDSDSYTCEHPFK